MVTGGFHGLPAWVKLAAQGGLIYALKESPCLLEPRDGGVHRYHFVDEVLELLRVSL